MSERAGATARGGRHERGRQRVLLATLLVLLALRRCWRASTCCSSRNRAVEEGNAQMKAGKAEEALAHTTRRWPELPAEPGVHFNRGAALYALSPLRRGGAGVPARHRGQDAPLKAAAFYNLGNAFFKKEKYEEAVEAYKRRWPATPATSAPSGTWSSRCKKKKEEDKKKRRTRRTRTRQEGRQEQGRQEGQEGQDKDKDDKKDDDKKDEQARTSRRTRTRPEQGQAGHSRTREPSSSRPSRIRPSRPAEPASSNGSLSRSTEPTSRPRTRRARPAGKEPPRTPATCRDRGHPRQPRAQPQGARAGAGPAARAPPQAPGQGLVDPVRVARGTRRRRAGRVRWLAPAGLRAGAGAARAGAGRRAPPTFVARVDRTQVAPGRAVRSTR